LEEEGGSRERYASSDDASEPEASDVAVILLPSLLAREAGGEGRFELEASTVGEALRALPVRDLLFDERGRLRPLVNVYVDRVQVDDLGTPLEPGAELRLVAAGAGG
jgi:molybdopterin converting factor small subunit